MVDRHQKHDSLAKGMLLSCIPHFSIVRPQHDRRYHWILNLTVLAVLKMRVRFARSLCVLAALCGLTGCASYNGSSLQAGVSGQTETRALMGEPATIHPAPSGAVYGESWEYPRGPLGRHTFMARFDRAGKLVSIDQVLTVETVGRIRIGQDTRDDVRRLLGRPGMVFPARSGGESWDYAAYASRTDTRKMRLSVTFNNQGIASAAGESYDPDSFTTTPAF